MVSRKQAEESELAHLGSEASKLINIENRTS